MARSTELKLRKLGLVYEYYYDNKGKKWISKIEYDDYARENLKVKLKKLSGLGSFAGSLSIMSESKKLFWMFYLEGISFLDSLARHLKIRRLYISPGVYSLKIMTLFKKFGFTLFFYHMERTVRKREKNRNADLCLRTMTLSTYKAFCRRLYGDVEGDVLALKLKPVEAKNRRMKIFRRYAVLGHKDSNNYYLDIVLSKQNLRIGSLWLVSREKKGKRTLFIGDFQIKKSFRFQGYGRKALFLVDQFAFVNGFEIIELNVFSSNTRALAIYKKHGYKIMAGGFFKDYR